MIHFSDIQTTRRIAFKSLPIITLNILINFMMSTIGRMQVSFIEEFAFSLWLVSLCCLMFCYSQRRQQQDHTSSYSTLKTMTTCVLGWSVSRLLLFPCNIALTKIAINLVGFTEQLPNCVVFMPCVFLLSILARSTHVSPCNQLYCEGTKVINIFKYIL